MFSFLHNYIPEPLLIDLGFLRVHWYGFLMIIGGLLGLYVVLKLAQKYKIKENDILDLAILWIIFSLLGARIYYVLYSWSYYQDNLLEIFKIWNGGLAIHGIIIGGFTAVFVFCYKKKISFWKIADVVVPGLAIAQVIGRVGNYFNQEIFGKPTDLPWGIPILEVFRPERYQFFEYFHPTFMYESLGNLIIFVDLMILHWLVFKKKLKLPTGFIFLLYLIEYSILRFLLEFLRVDFSPTVLGIRWAMIFSALIIIGSLIMIILRFKNKRKK